MTIVVGGDTVVGVISKSLLLILVLGCNVCSAVARSVAEGGFEASAILNSFKVRGWRGRGLEVAEGFPVSV